MSAWGPALRIARRSVRRNLVCSILIAVLVGLPIAGATFVNVLYHSSDAPERRAANYLGSADARIVVTESTRLKNFRITDPDFESYQSDATTVVRDPRTVDVLRLLPRGSRVERTDDFGQSVVLTHGRRTVPVSLSERPLPSRLQEAHSRLVNGRWPRGSEVVLGERLAERLRVGPGDAVEEETSSRTLKVSGVVRDDYCFDCLSAYAQPGSGLVRATPSPPNDAIRYVASVPDGTDLVGLAHRLADQGVALTPRDAYLHPDRYQRPDIRTNIDQLRTWALIVLIVGLGLLEVILLAGAAFAVGARKQVRDMGLLGAGGASPRQVRTVLLVQGGVLGAIGAVGGVAVGVAAARLGWPLWENLTGGILPVFRLGIAQVAFAAFVGLVSGVLAAVVPAIGASRMQPVDALAGRFRISRAASLRKTVVGGALVAVGVVLGLVGNSQLAEGFRVYAEVLAHAAQTGVFAQPPTPTRPIALILLGAVAALAGIVLMMPTLIGAAARLGRRLPLAIRLAVRDAGRHRHRTGPAASAIMVAVAGSVVMAFVLVGSARGDELRQLPTLPPHTMSIYKASDATAQDERDVDAAAQRAVALLPDAKVISMSRVGYATSEAEQKHGAPPFAELATSIPKR